MPIPAPDTGTLEGLYRRHFDQMVRRARTKLRDARDAEDVVQDSFLRIAERVDLSGVQNTSAYLSTVVNHEVVGRVRKHRQTRSPASAGIENAADPLAPDVAEGYARQEEVRILAAALDTLKPRQRRVLRLHSEGRTVRQIAALEGTSSHAISCVLDRAKEKLRREARGRGLIPIFVALGMRVRARLRELRLRALEHAGRPDHSITQAVAIAGVFAVVGIFPPGEPPGEVPARHLSPFAGAGASFAGASPFGPGSSPGGGSRASAPRRHARSTTVASFELVWRHEVSRRDEEDEAPPPSLQDQVLEIARHPENLLPTCGGLPICPASDGPDGGIF